MYLTKKHKWYSNSSWYYFPFQDIDYVVAMSIDGYPLVFNRDEDFHCNKSIYGELILCN